MEPTNKREWFLGIPLPFWNFGNRIFDLCESHEDDENYTFSPSSWPHITLLSLRTSPDSACRERIAELISLTRSEVIELPVPQIWKPNLVVCTPDTPWIKDLHKRLLAVEGLPPGDPTWEGENYTVHVTVAKLRKYPESLERLTPLVGLPFRWRPQIVDGHRRNEFGWFVPSKTYNFSV